MLESISFELLKTWCDRLCGLQITDKKSKGLFGGILCESCGYIHGRCADAIYPMITMYKKTGDSKYLDCAEALFTWQKNNVRKSNSLNINDSFNVWYGVSEFYQLMLGMTLYEFEDVLPENTYKTWYADFLSMTNVIYKHPVFTSPRAAANYIVTYLTSLAMAYKLTGEERFKEEAISMEENVLNYVTEDGHIYGEMTGRECNENGHKNIDLGYNVEESIGNLAIYAKFLERENVFKLCVELMRNSAEFMLPDGAWDNSWGNRAVKWTYYGSRTSDGAQVAFRVLADSDPMFYEMCLRNTLLMKEMTVDGLLMGGKMYKQADMLECAHHTFVHAKSLAYIVNHPFEKCERTSIPQDSEFGLKELKSAGVTLASIGDFRATVTATSLAFPRNLTLSGGSISCLYNKNYGVLLTSTARNFSLIEPTNMQVPFQYGDICQTLRIEDNGYTSMLCVNNEVKHGDNTYTVTGKLTKENGETSSDYELSYEFLKDTVIIKGKGKGKLFVPVVCDFDKKTETSENTVSFDNVTVSSNKKLLFKEGYHRERIFHTTGGFAALPLYVELSENETAEISIKVSC